MKIVSTDMLLTIKAMNHDLKIISIMLNCRWQGNETMGRALIKNRVCMCVVYQCVSPSPTLPCSCRFVSFSVRACACVRSRVRCWSRAYPHRHDGVGAGWSGCRMATYGTKLHAYTETEFSLSLLWDSDAFLVVVPIRSFRCSSPSFSVPLSFSPLFPLSLFSR